MSQALQYVGQDINRLVKKPRTAFEDNGLLTIHMRGDDIGAYPRYMWGQPPCSMYRKIIEEHNYTSVWLIKKGNNPCVAVLAKHAMKKGVSVKMKEVTIAEDLAAMARAKNLVLSFSSFAISSLMMNTEVRNIYRRRDAAWDTLLHAVINCAVWPGVQMFEYEFALQTKDLEKSNKPAEWLQSFSVSNIKGPFICKHGSPVGTLI